MGFLIRVVAVTGTIFFFCFSFLKMKMWALHACGQYLHSKVLREMDKHLFLNAAVTFLLLLWPSSLLLPFLL